MATTVTALRDRAIVASAATGEPSAVYMDTVALNLTQ